MAICECGRPIRGRMAKQCRWCRDDQSAENMTEAEVEALIEEQSRPENLPAWWPRSVPGGRSDTPRTPVRVKSPRSKRVQES